MAFFFVNDGTEDTPVSFEDDDALIGQALLWVQAYVSDIDVAGFNRVMVANGIELPLPWGGIQDTAVYDWFIPAPPEEPFGGIADDPGISGAFSGDVDFTGAFTGIATQVVGTFAGAIGLTGLFAGTAGATPVVILVGDDADDSWYQRFRSKEIAALDAQIAALSQAPAKRQRVAKRLVREVVPDLPDIEPARRVTAALKALADGRGWHERHIAALVKEIARAKAALRKKRNNEAALMLLLG